MSKQLMTPVEAADTLAVSQDTLRRWAKEGRLTRVRLSRRAVRYRRSEIEALIEDCGYRV